MLLIYQWTDWTRSCRTIGEKVFLCVIRRNFTLYIIQCSPVAAQVHPAHYPMLWMKTYLYHTPAGEDGGTRDKPLATSAYPGPCHQAERSNDLSWQCLGKSKVKTVTSPASAATQGEAQDSQGERAAGSATQWWDILESMCESAFCSGHSSTPAS